MHWDHWMRDHKQHKGREVVIPEVPRDYHMGIKGTFMDKSTHDKCVGRSEPGGRALFGAVPSVGSTTHAA